MARRGPRSALFASGALLVALGGGLVGCGDDGGDEGSQECRTVAPSEDGTTRVTIVGKNIQFDVGCVRVEPGPVEITFDNQDGGTVHNLRLEGGDVEESTELEPGKTEQVLAVDLAPGSYTYSCDPHPNMEGTLRVEAPAPAGTSSSTRPSSPTPPSTTDPS